MQPALGVFDIFGPVMIGPSSSHTAGASRVGYMTRQILGVEPASVRLGLLGTMGTHYDEYNSHQAIVGGMLGYKPDDVRINSAIDTARKHGVSVDWETSAASVEHPNTIKIRATAKDGTTVEVTGISTGGGKIRIVEVNGHRVEITGKKLSLLVIGGKGGRDATLDWLKKSKTAYGEVEESTNNGEHLLIIDVAEIPSESTMEKLKNLTGVKLVRLLRPLDYRVAVDVGAVDSIQKMAEEAAKRKTSLAEMFLEREQRRLGLTRGDLLEDMIKMVKVMRSSVEAGLRAKTQGTEESDAGKMVTSRQARGARFGDTLARVTASALGVVEMCASRSVPVVAAPTGGASGIVPGVVITIAEGLKKSDEEIALALFAAGGVGVVMAQRTGLSGSVAGCQAECGAASAIAAAAAAQLAGGSPAQVLDAAAIALKNHLGQVCDTVVGVRIPCIKRNGISAAMALASAEMALAGVGSAIPFDEVAAAMAEVGADLPKTLKGGAGGLSNTPTGRALKRQYYQELKTRRK